MEKSENSQIKIQPTVDESTETIPAKKKIVIENNTEKKKRAEARKSTNKKKRINLKKQERKVSFFTKKVRIEGEF